MNDKWIEFAIRIQSIAQAGLQYGKDQYYLSMRKSFLSVKITEHGHCREAGVM